jgi:hypothetical protein
MSAMRSYFEYIVETLCGIPRVTLLGTLSDWQSVKHRAEHLAEYGLEAWVRELSPILDELCAAAAGRPDRELWRSFYKYESRSGGSRVTGWINVLFPYLRRKGSDRRGCAVHVGPPWPEVPDGIRRGFRGCFSG